METVYQDSYCYLFVMYVNLTFKEIEGLMVSVYNLAQIDLLNILMPETKDISRPQLLSYLKTRGYSEPDLDRWEGNGLIHCHRNGDRGTRKYNRTDVMKLMNTINMKKIIVEREDKEDSYTNF